jgi:hypothetical protein
MQLLTKPIRLLARHQRRTADIETTKSRQHSTRVISTKAEPRAIQQRWSKRRAYPLSRALIGQELFGLSFSWESSPVSRDYVRLGRVTVDRRFVCIHRHCLLRAQPKGLRSEMLLLEKTKEADFQALSR